MLKYDSDARTQDFSENEDKNHADEESGLLGSAADTSITDDSNSETRLNQYHTFAQTS